MKEKKKSIKMRKSVAASSGCSPIILSRSFERGVFPGINETLDRSTNGLAILGGACQIVIRRSPTGTTNSSTRSGGDRVEGWKIANSRLHPPSGEFPVSTTPAEGWIAGGMQRASIRCKELAPLRMHYIVHVREGSRAAWIRVIDKKIIGISQKVSIYK